jgi:hypothetical protein
MEQSWNLKWNHQDEAPASNWVHRSRAQSLANLRIVDDRKSRAIQQHVGLGNPGIHKSF